MSDLTEELHFSPLPKAAKSIRMPLRLSAFIAGLLFSIIPLLTGCGGGGDGEGSGTGAIASLQWNPVQDSSVSGYFVHYGRQSQGQHGSCDYESALSVNSSSATVINLDPNTRYYFAVSAFNGAEGPCSDEVSLVTPPASA